MAQKLQEYLIYEKANKEGKIQMRKINGGEEIGIIVKEKRYQFPFEDEAEFFITKDDAIEVIRALQKYFHIRKE